MHSFKAWNKTFRDLKDPVRVVYRCWVRIVWVGIEARILQGTLKLNPHLWLLSNIFTCDFWRTLEKALQSGEEWGVEGSWLLVLVSANILLPRADGNVPHPAACQERGELHSQYVSFFVAQRWRHFGSVLLARVKKMEAAFISSWQSCHQSPAPAPEDQHQLPAGSSSGAGTVWKAVSMERISKSRGGKRDAWDTLLILAAKTVTVQKAV